MSRNNFNFGGNDYSNTGSRLEDEFLGTVNTPKYQEEAYKTLHQDEIPTGGDPEKRFNKILELQERAHKVFDNSMAIANRNNYINFRNSMALVERCQSGNPENPNRFFSKALYNYIKGRFDPMYSLKFFTAVGGTHLDIVHKIDCYFKLYLKETGEDLVFATIDITGRKSKDKASADVLLNISPEDKDKYDPSPVNKEYDETYFNQKIAEYGEEIIQAMMDNCNKKK